MKAWKILVLLGGIAGVVGFFMPFARGHNDRANIDQSVSAYQLAKGLDKKELLAEAEKLKISKEDAERAATELEEGLKEAQGFAIIAYAPAALLAIIGAFAVAFRRFGRLGGVFAFLLGGASAGIWALLNAAAGHAEKAQSVSLGIGAHLLLVAGIAGLVAGLGALVAPDRG
jgi:hypothetical protein